MEQPRPSDNNFQHLQRTLDFVEIYGAADMESFVVGKISISRYFDSTVQCRVLLLEKDKFESRQNGAVMSTVSHAAHNINVVRPVGITEICTRKLLSSVSTTFCVHVNFPGTVGHTAHRHSSPTQSNRSVVGALHLSTQVHRHMTGALVNMNIFQRVHLVAYFRTKPPPWLFNFQKGSSYMRVPSRIYSSNSLVVSV